MPLHLIEYRDQRALIYAKTRRGAENSFIEQMIGDVRGQLKVTKPTPIEAVALSRAGVPVMTVGKGSDVIMDNDPPEAKRAKPADATNVGTVVSGAADVSMIPRLAELEMDDKAWEVGGLPEDEGPGIVEGLGDNWPADEPEDGGPRQTPAELADEDEALDALAESVGRAEEASIMASRAWEPDEPEDEYLAGDPAAPQHGVAQADEPSYIEGQEEDI